MTGFMPALHVTGKAPIMRLFCPDCDAEVERVRVPQATLTLSGYGYRCRTCGWDSGLCGVDYSTPAAAAPAWPLTKTWRTCRTCGLLVEHGAPHVCRVTVAAIGG